MSDNTTTNQLIVNVLRPANQFARDQKHYKTVRPRTVHLVSESTMARSSLSFAYRHRTGIHSHNLGLLSSSILPVTGPLPARENHLIHLDELICDSIVLVLSSKQSMASPLVSRNGSQAGLGKKSAMAWLGNWSSLSAALINYRQRSRHCFSSLGTCLASYTPMPALTWPSIV